ncbi:hypothetical protein L2D01_14330 [Hyphomonadaceae bacterium ML37]|nr:hypothetical protein L2D01_14330 [Hyphomonadaceae bacterium ML37]
MKAFREILRNLWKAYLAIGIVTLILAVVYHQWFIPASWCDENACVVFDNRDHFSAFYITWLEDVIFFSLIGIPAVWISLRKPDDDHIEHRFNYLFNSDDARSHNIVREFNEVFTKMSAFCTQANIKIRLSEFIESGDIIKVEAQYQMYISNMYKDHTYKDPALGIIIEIDKDVENIEMLGEVTLLRTMKNNIPNDYISSPIRLSKSRKSFEKKIELEIDPNGSVLYEFGFFLYIRNDDDFWVKVDRYTKDASITILNDVIGTELIVSSGADGFLKPAAPILPAEKPTSIYEGRMESHKPVTFHLKLSKASNSPEEADEK